MALRSVRRAVMAVAIAALLLPVPPPARAAEVGSRVLAWGFNGSGEVGDGTTERREAPVEIAGMEDIVEVDAGNDHSLALRADGRVLAWGDNFDGQLGDGTTEDRHVPTLIPGLTHVVDIEARSGFSLAIRADGSVWQWGARRTEMAIALPPLLVPTRVDGLLAEALGAGLGHRLAAVDGVVAAWGYNGYGQLADGTTADRWDPALAAGFGEAAKLGGGYGHSIVLRPDGTLRAVGRNDNGQLGDGTRTQRLTPVDVVGVDDAVDLAVGDGHALALRADGTVLAWGLGNAGQLGIDFVAVPPDRLVPTAVPGLSGVTAVAAGGQTSLAITAAGAWTWGWSTGVVGKFIWGVPLLVAGTSGATDAAMGVSHGLVLVNGVALDLPADTTAPVGTVTIADGSATTASSSVSVAVPATDDVAGVSEVALSNDGTTFSTFAWAPSVAWTLSAGDGPKTVHAKWRDFAGNWSAVATDSVVLDSAGTGTTFTPIDPVRLVDTRVGQGLSGVFHANTARAFQVAGSGGVPVDAVAVTGNLTIVRQTASGYLSMTPDLDPDPPTSTVNAPRGDTRANNVTVPLSAAGTLSVVYRARVGNTADVIFDATGYFRAGGAGATFEPTEPARVLDSRVGNGVVGAFPSGAARVFQVAGSGGVPAGALAVTGNVTVVNPTGGGFVALAPSFDELPPKTSNLNFPARDTRANGITVRLSPTGTLTAVYQSKPGQTANLLFDVTGYFTDSPDGARFVPLEPTRALDTREAIGLAGAFHRGSWRALPIGASVGVPDYATALTGNLTVVRPTAKGFVTIAPEPMTPIETSTINLPRLDTRANGTAVAIAPDGTVALVYQASVDGSTHLVLDVTGYFR